MALYIELPVFKKSYDLVIELFDLYTNLPKSFKYTLGQRIQLEFTVAICKVREHKKRQPIRRRFIKRTQNAWVVGIARATI